MNTYTGYSCTYTECSIYIPFRTQRGILLSFVLSYRFPLFSSFFFFCLGHIIFSYDSNKDVSKHSGGIGWALGNSARAHGGLGLVIIVRFWNGLALTRHHIRPQLGVFIVSSDRWLEDRVDGLVHCRLFTRSSTRSARLTATLVSDFHLSSCVSGQWFVTLP